MNYTRLIEQVKQYVVHFFKAKGEQKFAYHNLSHTGAVVSNAAKIASHYQLGEKDVFIITAAAWFHDAGYFNGGPADHEIRGADMAAGYLKEIGIDDETIQAVQQCIVATRMPQSPKNLNEQIICDADLYHFGTDHFAEWNKLMRKEVEWRLGKKIAKNDWRKGSVLFMESHQYQTDYGRELLQDKKNQNLKEMRVDKRGALRMGIEKHGDSFSLFVSMAGEPMQQLGTPVQLKLDGPFYVGIGFCSHLPDKADTGILSNVVLENKAGKVH